MLPAQLQPDVRAFPASFSLLHKDLRKAICPAFSTKVFVLVISNFNFLLLFCAAFRISSAVAPYESFGERRTSNRRLYEYCTHRTSIGTCTDDDTADYEIVVSRY